MRGEDKSLSQAFQFRGRQSTRLMGLLKREHHLNGKALYRDETQGTGTTLALDDEQQRVERGRAMATAKDHTSSSSCGSSWGNA